MRKHRLALAALVLPFFGGSVLAQAPGARWSLTPTPADPPSRRENPGAADDNYMYVFGGTNNSTGVAMNDLWRFDGSTWTQMTADGAAGSPPAPRPASPGTGQQPPDRVWRP